MLLVALVLVFSGCAKKDDSQYGTVGFDAIIADNPIDKKYGNIEFSQSYVSAKTEAVEYDIQEFKEADGNVVIRYPSLTGKEYAVLNEIIYNEALYILKYYGEAYPKTFSSDVLEVFRDDKYLSIVYVGRGQLDDDSPINCYKYTTILDITEEKKVRLTDIACVDDDFIRNFRDSAKAQLPSELYDGLINWKSEELYEYLMSADRLDLAIDEQRDVFSYIDANGLNIVFPLPRAAGDYCTVTMWGDINYENKQ